MIIKPEMMKRMKQVPSKQSEYHSVGELSAMAELMLQGRVQVFDNMDMTLEQNKTITTWFCCYLLNVMHADEDTYPIDYLEDAHKIWDSVQKYGDKIVKHMVVNTIGGMVTITFGLDDENDPWHEDLENNWIFSYVYNVTCPDLSEFGDTFYEKRSDNFYHRIGQEVFTMKFDEIIQTIKDLAKSQGFYGRLLYEIEDAKENDREKYERIKVTLEEQNFKDAVDMVLFFET